MKTKFLLISGFTLCAMYVPTAVWAGEHVKAPTPKIPKARAVVVLRAALKRYPGRVIELKQSQKKGRAYYKVKVLSPQGVLKELYFDVEQGKLLRVEDESHKPIKQISAQVLPLDQFLDKIKLAEVLEVELKSERGQNVYKVKWLDNQGELHRARFDARTAQRLPAS